LELEKLRLEQARYRTDVLKWIVVAVGAVISFAVIDYGKLRLEKFRLVAENQRELLNSYLTATESPEPDVWKRKLHVLQNFADDKRIKDWAQTELKYIENFAALDALYRETLKVASQLVEPGQLADPKRVQARARFNQLYWGDLPYAGESGEVVDAMIKFRDALIAAERPGTDKTEEWDNVSLALIGLSRALKESTPEYPQ
jgi:hypothetical protein